MNTINMFIFHFTRHVASISVIVFHCFLATGDSVFMEDKQSLDEYVLSQDGIIYRGSAKHPIPTPWNFGQVPTPTLTLSTSLHLTLSMKHCHSDKRNVLHDDEGTYYKCAHFSDV